MNLGGFSWKRATGVTRVKQNISRATGIPLTKSGRQRKFGAYLGGNVGGALCGSGRKPSQSSPRTPQAEATRTFFKRICKLCGKRERVFKKTWLCMRCQVGLNSVITQTVPAIETLVRRFHSASKIKKRIEHCLDMKQLIRPLQKYQKKGLEVTSPKPSALLKEIDKDLAQLYTQTIVAEFEKTMARILKLKTLSARKKRVSELDEFFHDCSIDGVPERFLRKIDRCLSILREQVDSEQLDFRSIKLPATKES